MSDMGAIGEADVILGGVAIESNRQDGDGVRHKGRGWTRLLLFLSAVIYLAGFVHLRADFPNRSPWMDWSKMANEGWYASAAIHYFVLGRWYLPDSFNPAVAMPVWPAMLGLWFSVMGMSMIAARTLTMVLYGLSLMLLYRVVWRAKPGRLAAVVVLLTVVDPLCYAFYRLAILEPVTVFWLMLSLWLAGETKRGSWLKQVLLGVVICLLVLTKPGGVVLVPAVLYLMLARWRWNSFHDDRVRRLWVHGLVAVAVVVGTAAALWEGYQRLLVRPRYVADYALTMSLHAQRAHLTMVLGLAWTMLLDGMWIGAVLFPLAAVVLLLAVVWLRELWRVPLFGAALIAIVGQMAYVGYYGDVEPRYYLVMAMPMMIVVGLGVAAMVDRRRAARRDKRLRWGLVLLGGAVVAAVVTMAVRTVGYVLHPDYSYWEAAQGIAAIIDADGGAKPMLLSNSGNDITLWTSLRTVNESYTVHGLDALLERYRPGWYAAWPGYEDPAIEQVGKRYRMDAVARYRVFDDPARQTLVLYKLTPR
jgi:4-amino-4-deoxy-L-arabinose transferase-like glycosyltransferase